MANDRGQRRGNTASVQENQQELLILKLGRTGKKNKAGEEAEDGPDDGGMRTGKLSWETATMSQKKYTGGLK